LLTIVKKAERLSPDIILRVFKWTLRLMDLELFKWNKMPHLWTNKHHTSLFKICLKKSTVLPVDVLLRFIGNFCLSQFLVNFFEISRFLVLNETKKVA
jgi:hypothetical protein